MSRRRALFAFLSILALVLAGTVIVLSSFTYYLKISPVAYLSEHSVPILDNSTRWNASDHGLVQRIPRILHQTWKSETLPDRWRDISQACRDLMPDYEYMLWTDAASRDFVAEHYSWFLDTFDHYPYNIQRADAIRYFVLYHYGGIYLDLDIGCNRPLDPLLVHQVILPKTIPVGLSNDLMFSEKNHPFLKQTIHNLIAFNYNWILNYPTVMFSTGPMFLSMQYGLYVSKYPATANSEIRILPKTLYGKNAKSDEAPISFFSHYYGSSWHADDAAFISFLGTWGKTLMWLGLIILIVGLLKLPSRQRKYNFRRISGYDVLLPRWSQRTGRWHFTASAPPSELSTGMSSPISDNETSPIDAVPMVRLALRPDSPSFSDFATQPESNAQHRTFLTRAFSGLRNRVASIVGGWDEATRTPARGRRRRHSHGVLFFLPAIFRAPQDIELESVTNEVLPSGAALLRVSCSSRSPTPAPSSPFPDKQRLVERSERSRTGEFLARNGDDDSTSVIDVVNDLPSGMRNTSQPLR